MSSKQLTLCNALMAHNRHAASFRHVGFCNDVWKQQTKTVSAKDAGLGALAVTICVFPSNAH